LGSRGCFEWVLKHRLKVQTGGRIDRDGNSLEKSCPFDDHIVMEGHLTTGMGHAVRAGGESAKTGGRYNCKQRMREDRE